MHITDKKLSDGEAHEELAKVLQLVCALSNKEVLDKMRFHSHCEEIGFEVRNQLYKDGLIDKGDGVVKML